MSLQNRFHTKDLERIKAAVKSAETKISGEIVPVFVEASGAYSVALYVAFLFFAGVSCGVILVLDRFVPAFAIYDWVIVFFTILLTGFAGVLAATYIPSLKRLFIARSTLNRVAYEGARNAFLQEEVFATQQRTGILIFVSFFERKVIILADRGINQVVPQNEWDQLVYSIIKSIRAGKIVEGIEAAILNCGNILFEKGFLKAPDDVSELGDDLRTL